MMELVIDADRQRSVFADSCDWSEEIHMCLGWLEGGDSQGPSWDQLEPHLSKLRVAVVGLTSMRSDPYLLRRVYDQGTLRLVASTEGGFSPNTYVFVRGNRVRALVASAPFSATSYEQSVEALVLFEGERDEPMALQALDLLQRCRDLAHVPTLDELQEYAAARRRSLSRLTDVHQPALSSRIRRFRATSLDGLKVVTDRETIRRGVIAALDSFERACSWEGDREVRVRRERFPAWVHWVDPLAAWGAFRRRDDRHLCLFGAGVESEEPFEANLEISIATEDLDPKATGLFARREGDAGLYLVFRGLREGHKTVIPATLLEMLDGGATVAHDTHEARLPVVGNVLSPEFPTHVAGFTKEMKRYAEVLL